MSLDISLRAPAEAVDMFVEATGTCLEGMIANSGSNESNVTEPHNTTANYTNTSTTNVFDAAAQTRQTASLPFLPLQASFESFALAAALAAGIATACLFSPRHARVIILCAVRGFAMACGWVYVGLVLALLAVCDRVAAVWNGTPRWSFVAAWVVGLIGGRDRGGGGSGKSPGGHRANGRRPTFMRRRWRWPALMAPLSDCLDCLRDTLAGLETMDGGGNHVGRPFALLAREPGLGQYADDDVSDLELDAGAERV